VKSAQVLNQEMVHELTLTGRDAGELLKIMPGMAFNNGLSQGSWFTDSPSAATDGARCAPIPRTARQPNRRHGLHAGWRELLDPGNAGTQIANVNQDMTSEVKVLMSSYDAEYAKGPVVFQAFGKSGRQGLPR